MAAYRPPGNSLCPHCRNLHFPFCGTPLPLPPMPQFHGQHPNLGHPLFRPPLVPMDLPGMILANNNAFPHGRLIEHNQWPLFHPPQPFHTGGTRPFVTDGPHHPSFGMGNLRPPDGMCRDDLFGVRNPSLPPFHVDHERAIASHGNPLTIDRKRKHDNSFVHNNEWKLSGNWPKDPLSEEASNHNNAPRGFQEKIPIDIPIPFNAFNGSNPALLKGDFSNNVKEDKDGKKPSITRDFHHPPPSNNSSRNPYLNLDQTSYRSSFEERGMSYEARTFLSKDEEFLMQRGLQASEKKPRLSREEELLIEHGLLQDMETPEKSSIPQVGGGYGGGLETTGRMHQNSQVNQFSAHLHQERHSSFEQMGNQRLPEQGQFEHSESWDWNKGGRVIGGTENAHASNGGRFPNLGWDNNSRDIPLPPPPPPHALSDHGLLQHGLSHLPERNEEFPRAWDSSGNHESIHIHRQREEEGSEQGLINSGLYMRRQPFHTSLHDTNLGYPDRNSEEKSNQYLPTIRQSETTFDPQSNTLLGPPGQQMPPHWNKESHHLQFPTDAALRNPHLDVGLQTFGKSEPPPSYLGREYFDRPNNRQYEQNQQLQLPSDPPRWRTEFSEHMQQKQPQPQQEHLYHRDATITTIPSEARSLNRNTNMNNPPSSLPFFASPQDNLARIPSLSHTINPNNMSIPPLPSSSPPPLPPQGPMLSSPPLPLSAPLPSALASYTLDASDHQQFDKDLQSHHKSFHLQQHLRNSPVRHQNHQSSLPEVQGSNQIGSQFVNRMPMGQHGNHLSSSSKPQRQQEKLKIVDAVTIFRKPGRLTRPDRFVVILRGLPGSGKSYLAKALRDVEVMNGGSAPRIHAMDDYFMVEVEKVEDDEAGVASALSTRGKRRNVKKVMEYCYEAEMEEAYRASMFKAFRKTLEEGMFTFVIVDDRNLLVADFAQFWAFAKRSGYEVYILEAPYKDPVGCAARNVHGFVGEEVKAMANLWEPTPAIYFKLDVSNLFRGDELSSQDIIEVEMDADDMECDIEEDPEEEFRIEPDKMFSPSQYSKDIGSRWADKGIDEEPVASSVSRKEKMAVEDDKRPFSTESSDGAGNALSGLMMAYGKKKKSVRWPDLQGWKGGKKGFSIGVQEKVGPLIIGPGPGYNQSSNPIDKEVVVVEEVISPALVKERGVTEMRKSSKFVEQLRAEQEMFKAVFARRHHKSSGMDDDDD